MRKREVFAYSPYSAVAFPLSAIAALLSNPSVKSVKSVVRIFVFSPFQLGPFSVAISGFGCGFAEPQCYLWESRKLSKISHADGVPPRPHFSVAKFFYQNRWLPAVAPLPRWVSAVFLVIRSGCSSLVP
jgi:hypothetical protein